MAQMRRTIFSLGGPTALPDPRVQEALALHEARKPRFFGAVGGRGPGRDNEAELEFKRLQLASQIQRAKETRDAALERASLVQEGYERQRESNERIEQAKRDAQWQRAMLSSEDRKNAESNDLRVAFAKMVDASERAESKAAAKAEADLQNDRVKRMDDLTKGFSKEDEGREKSRTKWLVERAAPAFTAASEGFGKDNGREAAARVIREMGAEAASMGDEDALRAFAGKVEGIRGRIDVPRPDKGAAGQWLTEAVPGALGSLASPMNVPRAIYGMGVAPWLEALGIVKKPEDHLLSPAWGGVLPGWLGGREAPESEYIQQLRSAPAAQATNQDAAGKMVEALMLARALAERRAASRSAAVRAVAGDGGM